MSFQIEGGKKGSAAAPSAALHLEDLILCRWALRGAAQDAIRDHIKAKRGPKSFRVHAAPFLRLAKNYGRALKRVTAAAEQARVELMRGGDL